MRGIVPLCMLCCATAWGELPVLSLRYETAHGAEEDASQEVLLPEYNRHTWLATVRHDLSDQVRLGLGARYSVRENIATAGDTTTLRLTPRVDLEISNAVDLAAEISYQRTLYPKDLTRNFFTIGARVENRYDLGLVKIGWWLKPVFDLRDTELEKNRQVHTLSVGVQTGGPALRLTTRYRGVLRLPLGDISEVEQRVTHTGSISVHWDLDRWQARGL